MQFQPQIVAMLIIPGNRTMVGGQGMVVKPYGITVEAMTVKDRAGKFESAVYDRRLLVYNLNAYAGPHSKLLKKIDEEQWDGLKHPVGRYAGPIPLSGTELPGIPAMGQPPRSEPPPAPQSPEKAESEGGESDAD